MLSQKLKNNPPRERGITFPVGSAPRLRVLKLSCSVARLSESSISACPLPDSGESGYKSCLRQAKVQLQESRVEVRSRIASKKIGAAQ